MSSNLARNLDRTMPPEQFNQVVAAILDGKYSWACLLILQFAGYNPLHYIPYRTYNRLMKENRQRNSPKPERSDQKDADLVSIQDCFSRLEDLGHLETLQKPSEKLRGGNGCFWGDRLGYRSFLNRA